MQEILASPLNNVTRKLTENCSSESTLAQQACHHLLNLDSKKIRAKITLLATGICQQPISKGETLATVVEWLHAATLLHDDVIDDASVRRGLPTTNNIWNNSTSILSGDYLYSLAFKTIAKLKHPELTIALANATSTIVEGEILQLENRFELYSDVATYLSTITGKTAKLFATAAELPAIYFNVDNNIQTNLSEFGNYFGTTYQIIDDIKDYYATSTGKNQYQDLLDGTCTIPLIIALKLNPDFKDTAQQALAGCSKSQQKIQQLFQTDKNILAECNLLARNLAQQAKNQLMSLPESIYQQALLQLTDDYFTY